MKNLIIKNTFKILCFNILFQILITSAYFLFSYLVVIPFSILPISETIIYIYNLLIPIVMAAVKIFVLNIYGCYIKHNNKSQLVIPLIINLFIFLLCELLVFMNGKYDELFYLFMAVNPIASFYSGSICDLAFKEEFRIPFMFSMIVIENIVYLIVLYFSAKKKKDSEIAALNDTVIAENSDDSE